MTPPDTPSPNKRGRPQTDSTFTLVEGVVATGAVAPRQMPEQLASARRMHHARDLHCIDERVAPVMIDRQKGTLRQSPRRRLKTSRSTSSPLRNCLYGRCES